jgi:hypothetical protein
MGEPKENDPVTRTFRIENKYDEALREEAEKRGTSVNSLANQILKRFTESSRYFGRGQSITLSPRTFENIITGLSKEEIAEAGKTSGRSLPKDRLLMRGMPLNRESVIWYITEVLGGYNDWFTCDVHERKNHTLLHMRHVYNLNWSIFIESYIDSLLVELINTDDVEFQITDSTVSFELPK